LVGLDAGVAGFGDRPPPVRLECMLMLIADLLKAFAGGDFRPKLAGWAEKIQNREAISQKLVPNMHTTLPVGVIQ